MSTVKLSDLMHMNKTIFNSKEKYKVIIALILTKFSLQGNSLVTETDKQEIIENTTRTIKS